MIRSQQLFAYCESEQDQEELFLTTYETWRNKLEILRGFLKLLVKETIDYCI
jgi:hypothetical protein